MIDDDYVVAECEWFDDYAEDFSTLLDQRDYAGLIRRCRQRFERYPDDPYAVDDLADAYVQAGQFEQAIAFVRPYYEAEPDSFDFQHCILAALAGMGKAWDEFPWKSPPPLVEMSAGVLDECYRFLRPKRNPRSVFELYALFITRGHLLFSEDDLLRELLADGRFVVAERDAFPAVSVTAFRGSEPAKPGVTNRASRRDATT